MLICSVLSLPSGIFINNHFFISFFCLFCCHLSVVEMGPDRSLQLNRDSRASVQM